MQVFKNLNAGRVSALYCCYLHSIDNKAFYIGICKLKDVFDAPDAKTNDKWIEYTRGVEYDLYIIGVHEHIFTARNTRHAYVTKYDFPPCNIGAKQVARVTRRIRCVETGVIYDTQKAAAEAVGGGIGNISNHLRGVKGFNSVKGFTFEYDYSAPDHPTAAPMSPPGMETYSRELRNPVQHMPADGEAVTLPIPRGDA